MKRLLAAIAFLTRAPLPSRWQFGAHDIGRATILFPLVGAGLGLINVVVLHVLTLHVSTGGIFKGPLWLSSPVVAVLLVALGGWLTGVLHLDGLADMADGFGGGNSREDVLRIMRDHVIGSYGAVTLILLILIKVTSLSALIERNAAEPYLIIAPMLGRWACVPLARFLPYARRDGGLGSSVTDHVGWTELIGATALAGIGVYLLAGWRGGVCWLTVIIITFMNGRMCLRRINGVTGDTLGANTEVCEAAVLIIAVALTGLKS